MDQRGGGHRPEQDFEIQPESAELGDAVQQGAEETLVGPPGADPLDAGYIPPDRPYGLDDDEVVGAAESLDDRLRREEPEETYADIGRAGRLVIADAGPGAETSDSLEAVDVGIDGGAASAEEAAVHLIDPRRGDDEPGPDER
jgi:uncharacterized protein DUF5709